MIKRNFRNFFVFFIFWTLLVGVILFIYTVSLQRTQQQLAESNHAYLRQQTLQHLKWTLEKFRQSSSSFRKMSPDMVFQIKEQLKEDFLAGEHTLNQYNPTQQELFLAHRLTDALKNLLALMTHFEPLVYSRDAYIKSEVVAIHDQLLSYLKNLEESNELRRQWKGVDVRGLAILSGFILLISMMLFLFKGWRDHQRLMQLHTYALQIKEYPVASASQLTSCSFLNGIYGEIQNVLNCLVQKYDLQLKERYQWLYHFISDLQGPLSRFEEGVACLEDCKDLLSSHRLQDHLQEQRADLAEVLRESATRLLGPDLKRRIHWQTLPLPLWIWVDSRRLVRALVYLMSKVFETLPPEGRLSVQMTLEGKPGQSGVFLILQDEKRMRLGKNLMTGPEQDLLKHWLSSQSIMMSYVQKVIKAHQGSVQVAGVAGMSVQVVIHLPQERLSVQDPTETAGLMTYDVSRSVEGVPG